MKISSSLVSFESEIWPCTNGLLIKVDIDAIDFRWEGHTLSVTSHVAYEYFSE